MALHRLLLDRLPPAPETSTATPTATKARQSATSPEIASGVWRQTTFLEEMAA
jgi:hypothetical protein